MVEAAARTTAVPQQSFACAPRLRLAATRCAPVQGAKSFSFGLPPRPASRAGAPWPPGGPRGPGESVFFFARPPPPPPPPPPGCGVGGGLLLSFVDDPQQPGNCSATPSFWNYTHAVAVTLSRSVFEGNTALCPSCCGGGLAATNGGRVLLVNTTFASNRAGLFGGGE